MKQGDKNMKNYLFIGTLLIIILVLLALNLILPILSSPAPSYAAKNIQYKVIKCEEVPRDKENFEKLFNEYGKEGWEFVVLELQWGFYIFKR